MTLTTITLLATRLTADNHEALLDAARHKGKRDVERLVAEVDPKPDVPSVLRRLPTRAAPAAAVGTPTVPTEQAGLALDTLPSRTEAAVGPLVPIPPAPARAVVTPLSTDRYLLKVTLSETAHADLECVRDLLRHAIPTGDPATIVARALAVLRQQLERTRCGATGRPRATARPAASISSHGSRHVPAAVRRAVWSRDQGRCAFVGAEDRCTETGFLEFHHVRPFARGGPTTTENLELRCRAHNAHEAEREFARRADGR